MNRCVWEKSRVINRHREGFFDVYIFVLIVRRKTNLEKLSKNSQRAQRELQFDIFYFKNACKWQNA